MSGWDLYFGSIRLQTLTAIIVTILIFGFGAFLAADGKLILAAFVAFVGILTCFVMYYDYRRRANQ